ncbi:bleomycin resistance protein [Leptospira vanthielii]|nr:VOC family protein [Leptospira vanthielii]
MIKKSVPQLPSLDLFRSKDFYEDNLGFKTLKQYDDILLLEKDGIELHLWLCDDPSIPQNSSVYYQVDSIDSMYLDYKNKGIVHKNAELMDKPWGMREFYVIDSDGNLLKFGQVIEK